MANQNNIGKIAWLDISVEDAAALRDFYTAVVGWTSEDSSAATCKDQGGKVIVEPRSVAGGQMCVIEDPSGAIAGLYQEP